MAIPGTLHSHTYFSDGSNSPEKMVLSALEKKFQFLGISDHAPLPFKKQWAMRTKLLVEYLKEIKRLKAKYQKQIKIYLALEVDFLPEYTKRFDFFQQEVGLDYFIGSVHLLDKFLDGTYWDIASSKYSFPQGLKEIFGNDKKRFVERYFEVFNLMIDTGEPAIVAHIDLIQKHNTDGSLIDNNSVWYKKLMTQTLENIARQNMILEINTRGLYKKRINDFFPSQNFFSQIKELGLKVTASSDAHATTELDKGFEELQKTLNKYKIELISKINLHKP